MSNFCNKESYRDLVHKFKKRKHGHRNLGKYDVAVYIDGEKHYGKDFTGCWLGYRNNVIAH